MEVPIVFGLEYTSQFLTSSFVLRKVFKTSQMCEGASQYGIISFFILKRNRRKLIKFIPRPIYKSFLARKNSIELIILRKVPTFFPLLLGCSICLFHSTELMNSYNSLFGIIFVSQKSDNKICNGADYTWATGIHYPDQKKNVLPWYSNREDKYSTSKWGRKLKLFLLFILNFGWNSMSHWWMQIFYLLL